MGMFYESPPKKKKENIGKKKDKIEPQWKQWKHFPFKAFIWLLGKYLWNAV